MTVVEAVRERLLACAGVTALVSTRIWKDLLPQKPTLPAVMVAEVSLDEPWHARGPVGMDTARVQVDAYASVKADADDIAEAVRGDGLGGSATGLAGWFGSVGSPSFEIVAVLPIGRRHNYFNQELRQWVVMRDYMVTYRAS